MCGIEDTEHRPLWSFGTGDMRIILKIDKLLIQKIFSYFVKDI